MTDRAAEDAMDDLREYYLNELDKKDAEIKRLRAALLLSQSQNYCSFCGRVLDGKE